VRWPIIGSSTASSAWRSISVAPVTWNPDTRSVPRGAASPCAAAHVAPRTAAASNDARAYPNVRFIDSPGATPVPWQLPGGRRRVRMIPEATAAGNENCVLRNAQARKLAGMFHKRERRRHPTGLGHRPARAGRGAAASSP
jgi:hypothetical protein